MHNARQAVIHALLMEAVEHAPVSRPVMCGLGRAKNVSCRKWHNMHGYELRRHCSRRFQMLQHDASVLRGSAQYSSMLRRVSAVLRCLAVQVDLQTA